MGSDLVSRAICNVPADWAADFSQCLYEWQGLEAAGLAFLAAVLTAWFLWRQITQADRHEEKRIAREHRAIRTTLPLVLSGLCAVMKDILVQLARAKQEVKQDGHTKAFMMAPPPTELIDELKAVVSSTEDRTVTEPIAEIIREIQTLWARLEVLQSKAAQRRRAGLNQNITEWIIQAAEVHALVESLFDYSRGKAEHGPEAVAVERAESIIFQLSIEDSEIVDQIKKDLEKSKFFWTLT